MVLVHVRATSHWQALVLVLLKNDVNWTNFSFSPFRKWCQFGNNVHSLTKFYQGKCLHKFIFSSSKIHEIPGRRLYDDYCTLPVVSTISCDQTRFGTVVVHLHVFRGLHDCYAVLVPFFLSLSLYSCHNRAAVCRFFSDTTVPLVGRSVLHAMRRSSAYICVGPFAPPTSDASPLLLCLQTGCPALCIHELTWFHILSWPHHVLQFFPAAVIVELTSTLSVQVTDLFVSVDQSEFPCQDLCSGTFSRFQYF